MSHSPKLHSQSLATAIAITGLSLMVGSTTVAAAPPADVADGANANVVNASLLSVASNQDPTRRGDERRD